MLIFPLPYIIIKSAESAQKAVRTLKKDRQEGIERRSELHE